MKLTLKHTLTYNIGSPARAVQHALLTPLTTPQQKVERWQVEMSGFAEAATFRDGFGNRAHLVSQVKPEPELVVSITGFVETFDKAGVLGRLEYDPPPAMFGRSTTTCLADATLMDGLKDGPDRIALFHEVMGRVHQRLTTPTQMQTAGAQTQSMGGEDVGPDVFAHDFIGAVRGLGIPARFVTGYVFDDDTGGAAHAWAEAWDDRLGWIGFDPVNAVCPADTYIRLASGLDATSAQPLRSVPAWPEAPAETVLLTAE